MAHLTSVPLHLSTPLTLFSVVSFIVLQRFMFLVYFSNFSGNIYTALACATVDYFHYTTCLRDRVNRQIGLSMVALR